MQLPTPLRAGVPGWRFVCTVGMLHGEIDAWMNDALGVAVLPGVEMVEKIPHGSGIVAPHYHVSATHRGSVVRTCTDEEMERVREAFGLGGAEEDNHGPGIARHLRIVCGREKEPVCPCKKDGERIVDGNRVRFEEEGS